MPDRLSVVGLAAGSSAAVLGAQIARYRPAIAAIGDRDEDVACVRAAAGGDAKTESCRGRTA